MLVSAVKLKFLFVVDDWSFAPGLFLNEIQKKHFCNNLPALPGTDLSELTLYISG